MTSSGNSSFPASISVIISSAISALTISVIAASAVSDAYSSRAIRISPASVASSAF